MRRAAILVVVLGACGASRAGDGPKTTDDALAADAAPAPIAPPGPPGPDGRRWIPGDLHMHVAPIDTVEGQRLGVADLDRLAPAAGLEFLIVTPHVHPSTLRAPARRRAWMARWTALAAEARAARHLTIIPGVEYTVWGYGHFGVSGVDLGALRGDDVLGAARDAGGFVVVNHPYAVPTAIPGIPISERDLSFKPWTRGVGDVPHLDGVEVWNFPLGLANLASRPGGLTGEARAFATADQLARRERRPIAAVGGSDSHRGHLLPTTWVLAADASEHAILAALRVGATCVGGPDAGTLAAHGDADPPDRWARIGEQVLARATVELRWTGVARLFIDGLDQGEHDGAFTHTGAAGPHTYRLELGRSRCGFVYANLTS